MIKSFYPVQFYISPIFIIALGHHTRSYGVVRGMPVRPLGGRHAIVYIRQHMQSDDIRRGKLSSPFESTHDRKTSCVACPNGIWAAHAVD